jgi:uncharacterized protein YejL (UPF0352 family)
MPFSGTTAQDYINHVVEETASALLHECDTDLALVVLKSIVVNVIRNAQYDPGRRDAVVGRFADALFEAFLEGEP